MDTIQKKDEQVGSPKRKSPTWFWVIVSLYSIGALQRLARGQMDWYDLGALIIMSTIVTWFVLHQKRKKSKN